MVVQKTLTKVNNLTSNSTLENRWFLTFSFGEEYSTSKKISRSLLRKKGIQTYKERFNKLWKQTGISKQAYDYDNLVEYGRNEIY